MEEMITVLLDRQAEGEKDLYLVHPLRHLVKIRLRGVEAPIRVGEDFQCFSRSLEIGTMTVGSAVL